MERVLVGDPSFGPCVRPRAKAVPQGGPRPCPKAGGILNGPGAGLEDGDAFTMMQSSSIHSALVPGDDGALK